MSGYYVFIYLGLYETVQYEKSTTTMIQEIQELNQNTKNIVDFLNLKAFLFMTIL